MGLFISHCHHSQLVHFGDKWEGEDGIEGGAGSGYVARVKLRRLNSIQLRPIA